jgi:voltage-gated potassium channel
MLVLALLFVPVAVAPLLVSLSPAITNALNLVTWIIWAAFAVEYVVLLYLAPNRWHMVRTHLLDLAIIVLPFLRPLRVLRVLRAAAGLGRATVALRRVATRRGFRPFLAVVLLLLAAGGMLAYAFERNLPDSNITTPTDALWWAVVTATTVGYGDHFPVSPEGRGVAAALMLVGIGLLSVVTANIAAFFVEAENDDTAERLERIEALLQTLARHGNAPAELSASLDRSDRVPD